MEHKARRNRALSGLGRLLVISRLPKHVRVPAPPRRVFNSIVGSLPLKVKGEIQPITGQPHFYPVLALHVMLQSTNDIYGSATLEFFQKKLLAR